MNNENKSPEQIINEAIRFLKTYCRAKNECISCPMFKNCDRRGNPITIEEIKEK